MEAIARIRADIYFMGVTGIHPEIGLTTGDLEEAHIKRALSTSAAETHVLLTAEKINTASAYLVAPVSEIDGIVVESGVAMEALEPYARMGLSVVRA
jgi:DeoR/GlpR family transcriptional regulator of sugar metabolism